jgi:hypothetical protein
MPHFRSRTGFETGTKLPNGPGALTVTVHDDLTACDSRHPVAHPVPREITMARSGLPENVK